MRASRIVLIAAVIAMSASLSMAGGRPEPEVDEVEPEALEIELETRWITRQLIGQTVRDQDGEPIGSIDELLVDLSSGSIGYFVLELESETIPFGRYPVPLQLVLPDLEADGVILPVAEPEIFNWAPRMIDFPEETRARAWITEIDRFWRRSDAALEARAVAPGVRLHAEEMTPSAARYSEVTGAHVRGGPVLEAERLTGLAVYTADDESLGTVADYVVSLNSGRVPYALVATAEDRLHPVPLPLFLRSVVDDSLVFQASAEHLHAAPALEGNDVMPERELASLRDPQWEEATLHYWADIDVRTLHRYGMRLVPGLTLRHETLVLQRIVNPFHQELGSVEDIIITHDGRVLYLEIGFGGFLGLGENRYAIPISAIEVDPYREAIILDLAREELDDMPLLEPDALPTDDPDWDAAIRAYWRDRLSDIVGEAASEAFIEAVADREEAGAIRARSAFGVEVTADGRPIGEIAEMLVDVEDPAVAFVVIEVIPELDRDRQMVPIPVDRLVLDPPQDTAQAQVTPRQLEEAPSYLPGAYPVTVEDRLWLDQVRAYWNDLD